MAAPIGRRNLFAERRRALLGIAGVATALLLVLALNGIFAGVMRQVTKVIDESPADVLVAQAGVRNMHMVYSVIPAESVERVRAMPDVAWAEPLLYDLDAVVGHNGERQNSYVFGYVPGRRGGPSRLIAGAAPGPEEIVLDRLGAQRIGARVGSSIEVFGARWRVSGLTDGLTNITNTVSYVRLEDFARVRQTAGVVSYVLVGARAAPGALARRISTATGLSALTRAEFSAQERRAVQDMSTDLMRIMTVAAFAIGLAVVALTLYASTLSRLREVGVMKAIGARSGLLGRVVISQAVWTVGAALSLAVPLTFGLGWVVERASGSISLAVEPGSVVTAAVAAAALGALGALVPLIKVSRVDPATVFRRAS
ncbi:MAG: ABC transporter permease [Actinomycetota bacterium]